VQFRQELPVLQRSLIPAEIGDYPNYCYDPGENSRVVLDNRKKPSEHADIGGHGGLVVSGSKAQFRGTGTINGAGTYKFTLTTIDGDIQGKLIPDKFRIKITDSSGAVVYDNQMGAADDAEPATEIGGGSIVVHKV